MNTDGHGCFNPCCIGLAIAAYQFYRGPINLALFQSLLYWISHCGLLAGTRLKIRWKFQSLLYWISHCGPRPELSIAPPTTVSILVVLD